MATGSDQAVGYGLVSLAALIFSYYTAWVVILPFVDDDNLVHNYFLPRVYAVLLPIVAGVIVLIGLGSFIGIVMVKSMTKKAKKS